MRVSWLGVVAALLLVATPAWPCMLPNMSEHTLDPASSDRVAPTLARAEVSTITRGTGPERGCSGGSSSSCDDLGMVRFRVQGADETTPAGELGYLLELDSGTLPSGLTLPATPVRAEGGELWLVFLDGADDDQEAIEFVLRITAVDRAGNKSAAARVAVAHEGSGGSCAFGASSVRWGWGVLGVGLALAWRRQRRRT